MDAVLYDRLHAQIDDLERKLREAQTTIAQQAAEHEFVLGCTRDHVTSLEKQVAQLASELETERIVSASRLSTRSIDVGVIEAYQKQVAQLREQLDSYQNREAACCPEDFGFEEVISSLQKQLAEARAAHQVFKAIIERFDRDEITANHALGLLLNAAGCYSQEPK